MLLPADIKALLFSRYGSKSLDQNPTKDQSQPTAKPKAFSTHMCWNHGHLNDWPHVTIVIGLFFVFTFISKRFFQRCLQWKILVTGTRAQYTQACNRIALNHLESNLSTSIRQSSQYCHSIVQFNAFLAISHTTPVSFCYRIVCSCPTWFYTMARSPTCLNFTLWIETFFHI